MHIWQHVTCRIGSLETIDWGILYEFMVTCRIGSLERYAVTDSR